MRYLQLIPDNFVHLPVLLPLPGYLGSHQVPVDHPALLDGGAVPGTGTRIWKYLLGYLLTELGVNILLQQCAKLESTTSLLLYCCIPCTIRVNMILQHYLWKIKFP